MKTLMDCANKLTRRDFTKSALAGLITSPWILSSLKQDLQAGRRFHAVLDPNSYALRPRIRVKASIIGPPFPPPKSTPRGVNRKASSKAVQQDIGLALDANELKFTGEIQGYTYQLVPYDYGIIKVVLLSDSRIQMIERPTLMDLPVPEELSQWCEILLFSDTTLDEKSLVAKFNSMYIPKIGSTSIRCRTNISLTWKLNLTEPKICDKQWQYCNYSATPQSLKDVRCVKVKWLGIGTKIYEEVLKLEPSEKFNAVICCDPFEGCCKDYWDCRS